MSSGRMAAATRGPPFVATSLTAALLTVAALVVLLGIPASARAASVVDTILFPGDEPLGIAVYEAGNKIFVTEDDGGDLYVIDGTTHQTITTVDVGGSAFEVEVNETHGKVYVASDKNCCATGLTPGNGLISVIDADTNQLLSQINPGATGGNSFFELLNDEVHDKVYVGSVRGIAVIDPSTDSFTKLIDNDIPAGLFLSPVMNTVTNRAYFINGNALAIVNGATQAVDFLDLSGTGGRFPVDLAVNEVENKVYVTMILVPGQGEMGILIIDRDTGAYRFVGQDDLEPLAFNQTTNTLFSGVQVGSTGAIVDGATDSLTEIHFGEGGFVDIDVRSSTDNAYLASAESTVALNGSFRCFTKFTTAPDLGGGLVVGDVAVNQSTGRVYVNNRHKAGKVTVLQDAGPACVPPPPPQPPPPPTPPPPPPPPLPPPPPPPPRRPVVRQCVVPRVIGLRLATARLRIRARNCRVGRIRRARSRRAGRVLSQHPRAGARRAVGARVNVVVGRR